MYEENLDLDTIATPINIDFFEKLLKLSKYDKKKTEYLVNGLREGFDIGFKGPRNVVRESPNMKITCGTHIDLWNKVMKEVKEGHTAGPFRGKCPLEFYWQNPVGLIPKKGNPNETRMIVNLSYKDNFSVNFFTDKEECTVNYNDLDIAIKMILNIHEQYGQVYLGKCDGRAAFKQLPVSKKDYQLLVIKLRDPLTQEQCYFIDKVVVFGSSKSCRIFSEFAASLAHIAKHEDKHNRKPNEYLDDVLTGGHSEVSCNNSLRNYIDLCEHIRFPIAEEKTVWVTQIIVFLGLLLNTITMTLSVPVEKRDAAVSQIDTLLRKKKVMVCELQRLAGLLNFLGKAIVPGRTFTRRIYDRMVGLQQYHHLRIDQDLRDDLLLWYNYLLKDASLCRPFMDFTKVVNAEDLGYYTDAAKDEDKAAFGIVFQNHWAYGIFPDWIVRSKAATIMTLEMYAVLASVVMFREQLYTKRVELNCDNQAVVAAINKGTTKCKPTMNLIRVMTHTCMKYQIRVFAKYVKSSENHRADALSRLDFQKFWLHALSGVDRLPTPLPLEIWSLRREWWGLV